MNEMDLRRSRAGARWGGCRPRRRAASEGSRRAVSDGGEEVDLHIDIDLRFDDGSQIDVVTERCRRWGPWIGV